MSLMPRSRLISDSPRSPIVAETAMAAPNTSPPHHGPSRASASSGVATIMQAVTEPAKPSQDFFGLIDGAIGCLPNSTPAAYPPTSLATTVAMKASTRRDAVVGHEQQHREAGQQRDVDGDENAGGGVPEVAGGPVGQPPQTTASTVSRNPTTRPVAPRVQASPSIASAPTSSGTSGGRNRPARGPG